MSFAAVVQLCSDFSLAPKLISLHMLRKLYERLEDLLKGVVNGGERGPWRLWSSIWMSLGGRGTSFSLKLAARCCL